MWRVFWVPQDAVRAGVRRRVLAGWEDLPRREDQTSRAWAVREAQRKGRYDRIPGLGRRFKAPRSKVQSYSEAEFDQFTTAARHRFRAGLQRITENARHLQQWRDGAFAEDSTDW